MKLLLIVGTQLRHQYFFAKLLQNFNIVGVIEYERSLVQAPKQSISSFKEEDLAIEKKHLENLRFKEEEYFKDEVNKLDKTNLNIKKVTDMKELNSSAIIDWVEKLDSDVMIDYGSGILSDSFLNVLPKWKINLHGGLSPYFKGSATLLWPFYMQQPELAGVTFHFLSKNIDGGEILQHVRPLILEQDSVSDIGCRAIVEASEVAIILLEKLENEGRLKSFPQNGGKLFLERDYSPACIKVVNDLFERGLIRNYLKNKKARDKQYQFINQIENRND